jgi:hypothetical protein
LGASCGLEADKLDERVEVVDDALIESVEWRSVLAAQLGVGPYWREEASGQRGVMRSKSLRKTRQIE